MGGYEIFKGRIEDLDIGKDNEGGQGMNNITSNAPLSPKEC